MSKLIATASNLGPMVAGVLLGLSITTPVFAVTLTNPMPPRDMLLFGSLILLAVAVAVRLMRGRHSGEGIADSPDLRWWLNP